MNGSLLQNVANVIAVIISIPLLIVFGRIVWLVAEIKGDAKATRESLEEFVRSCTKLFEDHEKRLRGVERNQWKNGQTRDD